MIQSAQHYLKANKNLLWNAITYFHMYDIFITSTGMQSLSTINILKDEVTRDIATIIAYERTHG